jgi:hypothetical protein
MTDEETEVVTALLTLRTPSWNYLFTPDEARRIAMMPVPQIARIIHERETKEEYPCS